MGHIAGIEPSSVTRYKLATINILQFQNISKRTKKKPRFFKSILNLAPSYNGTTVYSVNDL